MKRNRIRLLIFIMTVSVYSFVQAQNTLTLTLDQTIALAADSSLEAFRYKNVYMRSYWEFRSFKAGRLPSLTLNLTPGQYNRSFIQRYDSDSNSDVFRQQQSYLANAGLSVAQNFDLLGGTFYMNTSLDYLRNFGANSYAQYSSIPISISYRQNLLGFNSFKWETKIEPLKYEKAKKQLVYDLENISEQAVYYFFNLLMAQADYELAVENVRNADTLYANGEKLIQIAAISRADLSRLELDCLNADIELKTAEIEVKRTMFALASFLNMEKNTIIRPIRPGYPRYMEISTEKALAEARINNPDLLMYEQAVLQNQREVDRLKKESMFSASLTASVGFNQAARTLSNVFRDPLRQDIVSLSVSIPLIDWGVKKGRYNMAKNDLTVAEIAARQGEIKVEEDIIMTVDEFNIQKDMIMAAEKALELAAINYAETLKRFVSGNVDIDALSLSRQRQQSANSNYLRVLQNYWYRYLKIRKITLFDFEYNLPISATIESKYLFINK